MAVPVIVTPPTAQIVELDDLRRHLRVVHTDEDDLIDAYLQAATSWLDGWHGVLGRCIMEQQWAMTYDAAGTYRLPFPDVSEISAVDPDDGETEVGAVLTEDAGGSIVVLDAAATVTMTAALPERSLPQVRLAVMMLVAHWFQAREGIGTDGAAEVPYAVSAMIGPLRRVPLV